MTTPDNPLPAQTFTITRADLRAYAEASGDHNPIHQDEEIALAVGLPGVIAHGMYTLALVARALGEWLPEHEVVKLSAKFINPVVVPDSGGADVRIEATATDDQDDELAITLLVTHADTKILGQPKAVLRARTA